MRKLLTVIVVILVVLLLAAGGIGGYLWYNTKEQVDQIVMMAKPFAEISYGGVTVSPVGAINVNNLRIMPNMVNDSITIDAIRLKAPDLLALLSAKRKLSEGKLPEALSVSVVNLTLPAYGGILNATPSPAQARSPFDDLGALGCGPVTRFGGNEWQEMGYDNVTSSVEIGYRHDAVHSLLNLQVNTSIRDATTLNMDMSFALPTPSASLMELASAGAAPKLAKLTMMSRDDAFNQRRNNYCAAKAGKNVNDYIADHVRLFTERLRANGVTLGPGLVEAYRHFVSEGSQITLTANPSAPINPAELQFYTAEDAIKVLGLNLTVNETPVKDLSMQWDTRKLMQALHAAPEPQPEEIAPAPAETEPVAAPQKEFHPIAVNELGKHLGKIAKLKTTTGAQYRGRLDIVAEGILKITLRKPGGSVTLSLRTGDITSAEVLY